MYTFHHIDAQGHLLRPAVSLNETVCALRMQVVDAWQTLESPFVPRRKELTALELAALATLAHDLGIRSSRCRLLNYTPCRCHSQVISNCTKLLAKATGPS